MYAHHVLDEWFERTVKRHCKGEVELFRYADDLVICCQYARDAQRIRKALVGRLGKFGLTLNEAKTRLVPFSRRCANARGRQAVFDFLGFTFYWGRSRRGSALVKVKTNGKRLRAKLKAVHQWAKHTRSRCTTQQFWRLLCAKVSGHIRYYGVSFNFSAVQEFVHQVRRIAYRWLNRRSQRRSFTWETFQRFVLAYPLPRAAVYHRLF